MSYERFTRELRSGDRGDIGMLAVLRQVDSTNLMARRVLRRAGGEGAERMLFVAWEQLAGRGRLGRSWSSSAGLGVYATLALQRVPSAPPLALLPLLAGVGLGRALRRHLPEIRLKWPNDLLVAGRKLGGILIETLQTEQGSSAAILGFGVNHSHGRADLPIASATSLRIEGVTEESGGPSLAQLVLELAHGLERAFSELADPDRLLDAYRELSAHRYGDELRCQVAERSIAGAFQGFDAQGRLRLRCGEETVVIAAGDVIEGEPSAPAATGS
jgi:BirA family biotin operon repressor/biotin-[acetyl-CoA-carboxylase] ligase